MSVTDLPAVNAGLNSLATVLLFAGWVAIKNGNISAHKALMFSAGAVSAAFLGCYVVYHYHVGSVAFKGTGAVRAVYFAILISHVLLAMSMVVLVPLTFWRAIKGQVEAHKKIARITWPVWMYVSVTGVAVYLMLYKLFPNG